MPLPVDSKARKHIPLHSGVFAYFPDALIGVAQISWEGNEKHNPGEPLHWSRGKSDDHEDCIARHSFDALQSVGLRERVNHLRARAWRSLASLQLAEEELAEAEARHEEILADRPCTCHPNDRPLGPCPKKYAATECQEAAKATRITFDPRIIR